ncbi:MAG: MATE family efflux transporter [Oscillospiraceae bacterium]
MNDKEIKNTAANPRSEMLGNAPVTSLMIKFAVPSIIAMLVGALYNIVDQLFIGNAVGQLGNAATNIAFPLTTSCLSLALLAGIGGASCFNLSMGRGEREKAPYFVGNAVFMMLVCGIVLMTVTQMFLTPLLKLFGSPDEVLPLAQEYVGITAWGFPFMILTTGGGHLIRADGSPRMTMFCNLLGAVINTALDAVFVLWLDWGMSGAAYATIIGQVISGMVTLVYLTRYKTVHVGLKHLIPRFRYFGRIASVGMASFFNQIAMMIVQIVMNNLMRHYGALSAFGESIPIAVSGIIMKINQITFSIVIGLGQGAQPIISFNYGAGKFDRVRKAFKSAVSVGAVVAVAAFLLFQLFPMAIISIFGSGTDEYFEFGVKFFRIFLFFTWLNCMQPICSMFFTSIGKAAKGVFLSLTRQILFLLPPMIVLPIFMGIDGILWSGPIADLLSGAAAIILSAWEFRLMKRQEQSKKA